MPRYIVAVVAALLMVGFALLGNANPAMGASTGSAPVGHRPSLPAGSVRVGTLPGATVIHADVVLAQRDPQGLQQFATAVSTPGSPLYRQYLGAGQVAAMFGPTTATVDAVRSALQGRGISVGAVDANRLLVPVSGTSAQLGAAFHTSFATYRLTDGRTAYANVSAPQVPASVASLVTGVVGLDDLKIAHPAIGRKVGPKTPSRSHSVTATATPAVASAAGPAPCTAVKNAQLDYGAGWLTNQLASSYQLTSLYNQGDLGAGQTVAVLELEPFTASDISSYQACYRTSASVSTVKISGGATGSQSGEAALDIENVAGFAPRSKIRVYSAPNTTAALLSAYSKVVSEDVAQTLSTSWLLCEQDNDSSSMAAENTTFQQAAAQGQSVFAASGDYGSTGCYQDSTSETQLAVDDPASQPYVTGVGGTTLNTLGPPPGETAWNESTSPFQCGFVGGKCGSGGGGISTVWPMPSYQSASGVPGVINSYSSRTPCGAASGYCREVPDISADGDVMTGYFIYNSVNGGWILYGGTSAAAPLWAAMTAVINALPQCTTRLGFANPTLYKVAARANLGGFHDIKSGTNAYLPQAAGHYPATTGYDLATGIGTPSATSLVAATCPGAQALHPVTPARILDTRTGIGGRTGAVPSKGTISVPVRGVAAIPATATSVVVNLTVTAPTGTGFLTAYPSLQTRPTASNLNFTPGTIRSDLAVVPIGSNGRISIYNGSDGSVQLVADVSAYNSTAAGSKLTPTAPVRVLDTRNGTGPTMGPVAAGTTITVQVTGQHGVPAGATAVVLNLTAVTPQRPGWLAAWPAGASEPTVSNVNFTAGQIVPNLAIVPIGTNGQISIHNGSAGSLQIVADQFGYYTSTGASLLTGTTPTRLLDTRSGLGVGTKGAVAAGHVLRVKVAGVSGIPAGIKAIVLNVTETSPTKDGFITAYPDGITRPTVSNLNYTPALTAPNLVIVPVSASGYVDLYNGSVGTVQLIADCFGFYR
ncbi:S53 family peptidase [Flexivirga alba]|uniref:Protease pro-enzyme activation domain-containing protein n=1 Tax=Flexivirga alba TaxID=702742 RepID=A0ABW2ADQ5_9MICO